MEVDRRARKEAMCGFDERAASRYIDDPDVVPGPNACADDAVLVAGVEAPSAATLGLDAHRDRHCRLLRSYCSTRVFPVSPKMTTAY